tara:strand:- start:461 stop:748 length:288 start_codon:yes stop_codon:yes gene_type:complete
MFTTTFNDIMNALEVQPVYSCAQKVGNPEFEVFKEFVVDDTIDHNEARNLTKESPVIQQILNAEDTEQLEQYLRVNLDYCDDCILKMYRRYVSKD